MTSVAWIPLGHKILGQIHMDADEFDEAVFQFKKATELSQVGLCLLKGVLIVVIVAL